MKTHPSRYILVAIMLAMTAFASFAIPRAKYKHTDILSKIQVPSQMQYWRSRDVSDTIVTGDQRYFFIGKIFARQYVNDLGERLLFLVLDAGNFHHPKVCFGSSGFTVKPLPDVEFNANGKRFKAHVLYMDKGISSSVVIYWMCIDKKPVDWASQKIIQLFSSILNRKKVGLMGRLDIPVPGGNTENALTLAKGFIRDISQGIPPDQAAYLFGE